MLILICVYLLGVVAAFAILSNEMGDEETSDIACGAASWPLIVILLCGASAMAAWEGAILPALDRFREFCRRKI